MEPSSWTSRGSIGCSDPARSSISTGMPLRAAGVASIPGSVAPSEATSVSVPSRRMRSIGARSTTEISTVAGSSVVTIALATQGSDCTRPWIAAPLIVKMLCSGTSAAATTAPVVSRWVPTTVTRRTWNPGSVSASARRPTCTVSAAAAISRRLQEVCRLDHGWRRRRAAARVTPFARRRHELRPGAHHQPAHSSRRIGDERRLGANQGDVARPLVEHLGAHRACSVR